VSRQAAAGPQANGFVRLPTRSAAPGLLFDSIGSQRRLAQEWDAGRPEPHRTGGAGTLGAAPGREGTDWTAAVAGPVPPGCPGER